MDSFRTKQDVPNYESQYYTVIGQHDFMDDDKNPMLNDADDNKINGRKNYIY